MIGVMIIDPIAIRFRRQNDRVGQIVSGKFFAVKIRDAATSSRPSIEVWQFHLQNRCLQFIETKISADELMMITRLHPVLSTNSYSRGQTFIVRDDRAGVPGGTQILRRIETKAADVADRARGCPSAVL